MLDRSGELEGVGKVAQGAYVLAAGTDVILIATGSEVSIALEARELLAGENVSARVVSMPCVEWFTEQDESYQREVLPPTIRARVSVEAGITPPWKLFVGDSGRFNRSRPLRRLGRLPEDLRGVWHHRGAGSRCRTRQSGPGLVPAPGAQGRERTVSVDVLGQLSEAGVSVWLDDISRDRLRTGNLQSLMDDYHVVGVTSNPTIFAKALSGGSAYDEQVKDLKVRGVSVEEASRALTTYDIRWACDVLRPVYDATNGVDGRVSIEVDPRVAKDTAKTIAEAKNLWWMVDRPNAYIKIPATHEGLEAITETLAQGISVNVTLIFSLERLRRGHRRLHGRPGEGQGERARPVHDLLGGLVLRQPGGHRGRQRLDKLGTPEATALRGKAAIANARLAYELFENKCADRALAGAGRGRAPTSQRPLWASTSTKDPTYPDTMYVVDLVAVGHGQHHARGHHQGDRGPR